MNIDIEETLGMTRDQIAAKIRWEYIIWAAGLVNVIAMLPQIIHLLSTHETAGLSLGMFWTYFLVQVCFSLEGFFKRNTMLMWCLGLSSGVSACNIALIYYFRP